MQAVRPLHLRRTCADPPLRTKITLRHRRRNQLHHKSSTRSSRHFNAVTKFCRSRQETPASQKDRNSRLLAFSCPAKIAGPYSEWNRGLSQRWDGHRPVLLRQRQAIPKTLAHLAKVVVKDGGSDEPTIELTRGTSEQQASQQRYTTEQLRTATEENLKKLAGRQLTASQQEMVTQIKQFMEQAKSAVADEDLERGHSLAMKAHLLSEELLKP